MPLNLFDEARAYLAATIRDQQAAYETLHPWRNSWQFTYLHSLRVENIAMQLLSACQEPLREEDAALLRAAAILHDIGRLQDRQRHAELGAEISAAWLRERPDLAAQLAEPERLPQIIAAHTEKNTPGPDLLSALLKDADLLDEIGAFSIFMAANWLDRATPFFFYDLRDRLVNHEVPFCEKVKARLQTSAARAVLAEKQKFVEGFIAQLDLELTGVPRDACDLPIQALPPG